MLLHPFCLIIVRPTQLTIARSKDGQGNRTVLNDRQLTRSVEKTIILSPLAFLRLRSISLRDFRFGRIRLGAVIAASATSGNGNHQYCHHQCNKTLHRKISFLLFYHCIDFTIDINDTYYVNILFTEFQHIFSILPRKFVYVLQDTNKCKI